ncbi:MAG: aspartate aminotransferase family protein, partial [Chloroflexi bacterium]|nr:aspartate aminotransferase family protein [Chloroflexota bacterium]
QAKEALINGVRSIDGLETWGDPELSIFTFGSRSFDIFAVADVLAEAGWVPNRLTEPPGIHHLITPVHLPVVEEYLSDLAYAVEKARSGKTATTGAKVSY